MNTSLHHLPLTFISVLMASLVGGWTNPFKKIWVKMGSSSPIFGVNIKNLGNHNPSSVLWHVNLTGWKVGKVGHLSFSYLFSNWWLVYYFAPQVFQVEKISRKSHTDSYIPPQKNQSSATIKCGCHLIKSKINCGETKNCNLMNLFESPKKKHLWKGSKRNRNGDSRHSLWWCLMS